MSKIGGGELLVILLVALLIFGPAKLPALGKMAGKAIGTLRHYADSDNWGELADDDDEDEEEPPKKKKTKKKEAEPVKDEPAEDEPSEEETSEEESVGQTESEEEPAAQTEAQAS